MKKLKSILVLLLVTVSFICSSQIVEQPFNYYNVGSVTTLSKIVPFEYNLTGTSATGNWLVAQIDYQSMTGDSCKVRFYVSGTPTFTGITTALNASSLVKAAATSTAWKTGQGYGTAVTKYEMINITNYPTGYLKVAIDTTTGITTGRVTVTVKPYVQGYYPTWKESLIKEPISNYSIATHSKKTVIIPFFPDRCVKTIVVQADYLGMAGNAFNLAIFASGSQIFTDTNRLNNGTALKWTTGANISKWDTIYLGTYPVQYLKIVGDTCTGANTAGKLTVRIKPIFK